MKTLMRRTFGRKQRGAVAVETAIVMPILITLFTFPLLFLGTVFWFYTATQKAAHDGARFLSTATQVELRTAGVGGTEAAVAALARNIINEEISVVRQAAEIVFVDVQCDFGTCGIGVPSTVRVLIQLRLRDKFFPSLTGPLTGDDGLLLKADVTMRYVGP